MTKISFWTMFLSVTAKFIVTRNLAMFISKARPHKHVDDIMKMCPTIWFTNLWQTLQRNLIIWYNKHVAEKTEMCHQHSPTFLSVSGAWARCTYSSCVPLSLTIILYGLGSYHQHLCWRPSQTPSVIHKPSSKPPQLYSWSGVIGERRRQNVYKAVIPGNNFKILDISSIPGQSYDWHLYKKNVCSKPPQLQHNYSLSSLALI